jgi:hypothetical protein
VSPLFVHWVLQDALQFPDFTFTARDRQRIIEEIRPAPPPSVAESLVQALQGAVAAYRARKTFEGKHSRPTQAIGKITSLVARIDQLDAALRELDWGTRRALAPFAVGETTPSMPPLSARKPPEMDSLDRRLIGARDELLSIAGHARAFLAHTKPTKKGPRTPTAREAFVVDLADALHRFVPTQVAITATAGGAFETIVRVSLDAADGAARADMRRVVLAGVKAFHAEYRHQGVKMRSR